MKRGGEVEMGIEAIGTYKLSFIWGETNSPVSLIQSRLLQEVGNIRVTNSLPTTCAQCTISGERAPNEMPWKLSHKLLSEDYDTDDWS